MDNLSAVFPEIKCTYNPKDIPWPNSVVWTVQPRIGPRVYEWMESKDIQNVSWANGQVRIIPHHNSILSDVFQCIVLPSGFIAIGKNVQAG